MTVPFKQIRDDIWEITCSICEKPFDFEIAKEDSLYKSISAEESAQGTAKEFYLLAVCDNSIDSDTAKEPQPCETVYRVILDDTKKVIKSVYRSPNSLYDMSWLEMGKDLLKGSLDSLDKRAEYMITTITALIAVDFTVLLAFKVPELHIKFLPQLVLVISAFFFFLSLRIKKYSVYTQSPTDIRDAYDEIGNSKYFMQNIGFAIFIVALIAIAASYLLVSPTPQQDPTEVILDGNLNISSP